jgi:hypothetical protein
MSRTIGFGTILGMMVASIIIVWPRLVQIEPEAATSVTRAEAAVAIQTPTISPFEIMAKYENKLPMEVWDAF